MKCPGCDRELRRGEDAQAMTVFGRKVPVPAFCDDCCRSYATTPGNRAALERLVSGKSDAAEAERVRAATPTPYDKPAHPPENPSNTLTRGGREP